GYAPVGALAPAPPLCGDGAPRRDQAVSGRAFRDLCRRCFRARPGRPTRVSRAASADGLADDADATVHRDHRAGDVATGPAGEEDRDAGHVVGLADPAERKARTDGV